MPHSESSKSKWFALVATALVASHFLALGIPLSPSAAQAEGVCSAAKDGEDCGLTGVSMHDAAVKACRSRSTQPGYDNVVAEVFHDNDWFWGCYWQASDGSWHQWDPLPARNIEVIK